VFAPFWEGDVLRVHSPVLALLGLLAVAVVALQLFQGSIGIPAAAQRIGIGAAGLVAVERFLLPVARSLVGARSPRGD